MNRYEAIADIQKRQIAFLNDTVNHYNLYNRNEVPGACRYHSIRKTSEGCAIGRHLDKNLAKKIDDTFFYGSSVSNDDIFKMLPIWMQEMGQGFLVAVQQLHDNPDFWTLDGISEEGVEEVNLIKEYITNRFEYEP